MSKNGTLFISMIDVDEFIPATWDPYAYRQNGESKILSDFVEVHRLTSRRHKGVFSPFRPIVYKHIHNGHYLSFTLEYNEKKNACHLPTVGEQTLLFGTMRAYLGNVLVTPMAEWIHNTAPLHFHVKSEFVIVSPHDNFPYFWLSFMKSQPFLQQLPIGAGGTRPRLQADTLAKTPVHIPPLDVRKHIHDTLKGLAREEWRNCLKIQAAIHSMLQQLQ